MGLQTILHGLNFSDKEAAIYIALVEKGSAIASDIAKAADLNRPTTYDILRVLTKRGLVSKYKKGSAMYFQALDPRTLVHYIEREKEEAVSYFHEQKARATLAVPLLLSLQNSLDTKPRMQFFDGRKGMREAYEDTLTARGFILAYTNVEAMYDGLPHFFPEYWKRRTQAKIPIRAIFVHNAASIERAKKDREELRETRFLLNPEATFSPEIKIYNNKMLIASWKEKIAIIIESKELVELQQVVFYSLWSVLPKGVPGE